MDAPVLPDNKFISKVLKSGIFLGDNYHYSYFRKNAVMIKNYFKVAFRNAYQAQKAFIYQPSGLSVGMAVAMLIEYSGYMIELSFDKASQAL